MSFRLIITGSIWDQSWETIHSDLGPLLNNRPYTMSWVKGASQPSVCCFVNKSSILHASASADSWNQPWTSGMKEEKKKSSTWRWTNLYKRGLTSADRSNKATLPLTVPPCIQVICKGFTPAHIMITIHRQAALAFPQRQPSPPDVVYKPKGLIQTLVFICGTNIIVSSTDSDLEAFSHNPTDDSFASLPDRTDANTKYPNERFLSY